ncbi:hypothetical protein VQH23_12885 [Pararoseomonas sp. SCSIO 73927]|uniref:hypothetical protein n=1 Tax=Pararoseomonas sp. SCSIO 73927 TaxID=3114537 RepID=UPI0030CBDD3F
MLFRILQGVGILALIGCGLLALQGTPLLGPEWSRARILYAGAGAVSALSLLALGRLGIMVARMERAQAALSARLDAQRDTRG